jgi:hypothetical protein
LRIPLWEWKILPEGHDMNKARRKQLDKALLILAEAAAKTAEARAAIVAVKDDEQEAYDNLSEGAQDGDNGQAMQSALSAMEEAVDTLDAIDLAAVQKNLDECEIDGTDLPDAKLTAEEADARREARLPDWAKERIARLEKSLADAQDSNSNMFAEATGAVTEFVIDDYETPLRGRVLPASRIAIPALELRVEVNKRDGTLEISRSGFGRLKVIPHASNTLYIGLDD